MKKVIGCIFILIMIAALSCSSRKRYSEIREFISEVVSAQDEFLVQIDKSVNADDAVTAVNNFGNKLITLSGKSLELKKKYPEIVKWVNDPPAELKSDMERLNDTESKFGKVFQKENIKTIVRDKKAQEAFRELNKKMETVKFFE